MEVSSPGGFPAGITPQNVLWRQSPRNRRLAETLAKCGLVERSGQGVNLMFEESIKESKPLPDYSGSDDFTVDLFVRGEIQDPQFLRFLEKIGTEKIAKFSTKDLLIIDLIHRDQPIPEEYKTRLPYLLEQGVDEKIRNKDYVLSGSFHKFIGKKGVYTRKVGLDKEENKALLLKHIQMNQSEGSPLKELMEVLPSKSKEQVIWLLRTLAKEGKIHFRGWATKSRYYPGGFSDDDGEEHIGKQRSLWYLQKVQGNK